MKTASENDATEDENVIDLKNYVAEAEKKKAVNFKRKFINLFIN